MANTNSSRKKPTSKQKTLTTPSRKRQPDTKSTRATSSSPSRKRQPNTKSTRATGSSPSRKRQPDTKTIRTRTVSSNFAENIVDHSPAEFIIQNEPSVSAKPKSVVQSRFSEEKVSRAFLFVFIAALSFVIGTGVGNQSNQSLVDSAIDKLIDSAPAEIDRKALERAAIEGALKASGDEWANYFPQSSLERLNEVTSNSLTGIGISVSESRSGAIQVNDIVAGSVAARSGIQLGDQLLAVNGTDVQGATATAVAALLRGEIGREVDVTIRRDTKQIEFTLQTEKVDLRTVDASQIDPKIVYISISNFAIGTASEVQSALAKFNSSKGVILDLRDNPGGIIEEAVKVAEQFIGRGVIVSYKVNGDERVFTARNSKPNPAPVVLLINKRTTSAAELLAAAFQDRNRGVVIGERSYGKGSVQEFVTLKDGSKLELTVALYLTPSGRTIEGLGVTPDLAVGEKELAVKALQILGGLAELASQPAK